MFSNCTSALNYTPKGLPPVFQGSYLCVFLKCTSPLQPLVTQKTTTCNLYPVRQAALFKYINKYFFSSSELFEYLLYTSGYTFKSLFTPYQCTNELPFPLQIKIRQEQIRIYSDNLKNIRFNTLILARRALWH